MKERNVTSANTINYLEESADVLGALENVEGVIAKRGIEPSLHHLVLLRASQINGCAFCVRMHTSDAREAGETDRRLDHLIVWKCVNDFTAREKAAFAWTEALTELHKVPDLDALRGELKKHFSEHEIASLTSIVAMINLWNRIQISNH
ncbi:carboxymuconolactone decarboxylase family protein [Denitrobaculum tricleocarpae]|uniref:Carboxymuconolactone decarboxylase family protein n=1 Tax=Denitrobaculum tricleocarpae TaxID=2591009 RepID=A0A545T099_9PROT|nr:carboxymuconolactone decarboxylase family protein [Denitrobaculum tricleocarpae]